MQISVEEAFEIVRSRNIDTEVVNRITDMFVSSLEGRESVTDRRIFEAVCVCLFTAARNNWGEEYLEQQIGGGDSAKRIANAYQKNKEKLIAQAKTIRYEYEELVDVDWHVSKTDKTSVLGAAKSSSEPLTTVNLKTVECGDTVANGNIRVTFDEVQLTDFVWKLKEAQNMRDKILAQK